jgi:hypothetical protein
MERCEIHTKRHGEMRNSYKILIRKSYGWRSLGRSRCRWKDNKNVDFRVTGVFEGGDGFICTGIWRADVETAVEFGFSPLAPCDRVMSERVRGCAGASCTIPWYEIV